MTLNAKCNRWHQAQSVAKAKCFPVCIIQVMIVLKSSRATKFLVKAAYQELAVSILIELRKDVVSKATIPRYICASESFYVFRWCALIDGNSITPAMNENRIVSVLYPLTTHVSSSCPLITSACNFSILNHCRFKCKFKRSFRVHR